MKWEDQTPVEVSTKRLDEVNRALAKWEVWDQDQTQTPPSLTREGLLRIKAALEQRLAELPTT